MNGSNGKNLLANPVSTSTQVIVRAITNEGIGPTKDLSLGLVAVMNNCSMPPNGCTLVGFELALSSTVGELVGGESVGGGGFGGGGVTGGGTAGGSGGTGGTGGRLGLGRGRPGFGAGPGRGPGPGLGDGGGERGGLVPGIIISGIPGMLPQLGDPPFSQGIEFYFLRIARILRPHAFAAADPATSLARLPFRRARRAGRGPVLETFAERRLRRRVPVMRFPSARRIVCVAALVS
jgi:hypothetical protein